MKFNVNTSKGTEYFDFSSINDVIACLNEKWSYFSNGEFWKTDRALINYYHEGEWWLVGSFDFHTFSFSPLNRDLITFDIP